MDETEQYTAYHYWPTFSEDYSLGKFEEIGSLELLDGYAGEE